MVQTRVKLRDRIAETERELSANRGSTDTWVSIKDSDVKELIEHLERYAEYFSKWERDFLESVTEFMNEHSGVTRRQYDGLRDLAEWYP